MLSSEMIVTSVIEKIEKFSKEAVIKNKVLTSYRPEFENKNHSIGCFYKYYGKEYFEKHGLSADSYSDEIISWMKKNNIEFVPHFHDHVIGNEHNAIRSNGHDKETFVINESKLALHKRIFKEAQAHGYEFYFDAIHISGDCEYLQYIMYLINPNNIQNPISNMGSSMLDKRLLDTLAQQLEKICEVIHI